jgi:ATP-dependent DNA helicase RecQ
MDRPPGHGDATARAILARVFGHDAFRPGQEELIGAVLAGRDAIGILPTGGGKSLIYQLPARLLPGTVLVVSPLIALMHDQLDALARRGLRATVLNSSLDWPTRRGRLRELAAGAYDLVYVAPEALAGGLRRSLRRVPISLVAVDEAHCISEWGHDFRPAYRRLGGLKGELGGGPVLALTATATRPVARDIIDELGMVKPLSFRGTFFRPNLRLAARRKEEGRGVYRALLTCVCRHAGQPGIIYAATRRGVEVLAAYLQAAGVRAVAYHAGLPHAVRAQHQEAFARDAADVVVATVAFGMGIDKANVRYVVHRELPRSIDAYYQQIGRAGRDGRPAECVLFYGEADVWRDAGLGAGTHDPRACRLARLRSLAMLDLAEPTGCRWQRLAAYFDERIARCGSACDVCAGSDIAHTGPYRW